MKGVKTNPETKKKLLAIVKDLYENKLRSITEISTVTGKPRGSVYLLLKEAKVRLRSREGWWQEMRDRYLRNK